jgi:hypothetical protein
MTKPKKPKSILRRAAYWLDDYAQGLLDSRTIKDGGRFIWRGYMAAEAKADHAELRALAKFLRGMARAVK